MRENISESSYPTIRQAIIVLFVALIGMLFFSIFAPRIDSKYYFTGSRVIFILPMILFLLRRKFSLRLMLRLRSVSLRIIGLSLVIGLSLSFIGEELDRLMTLILPLPDEILKLMKTSLAVENASDWLVLIVGVIMLTAFFEELLFRGFLQSTLESKLDVTKSVMATAFIFSFFYFNPVSIVQITLAGVIFGVLAWKSDSLLPSTMAHITINAVGIAMTENFLGEQLLRNWYGHVHPIILVPACFALYFSMVLFYKFADEDSEISTYLNEPL